MHISATYFDIDFANRIAIPGNLLDAFRNPQNYVGYLMLDPTPQQIADYLAIGDTVTGAIPPDGIEAIWDELETAGLGKQSAHADRADEGDHRQDGEEADRQQHQRADPGNA